MRAVADFFCRIRVRLTVWYVFLLAIVLVLFSLVLFFSLKGSLLGEVDRGLRNSAGQVVSGLDWEDSHLIVMESENSQDVLTKMAAQGFLVVLSENNGRVLQSTGPYSEVIGNKPTLVSGYRTLKTPKGDWRVYTVKISVPHKGQQLALRVGESLSRTESALSTLLVLELVIVPITLCLAVVVGLFFAGRALKPVGRITELAASIDAVDLDQRLDLDLPDDDLGRLARTFDDMLQRLDQAFSAQKRFASEAAHELRTPLTIMKGNTEVALARERTAAEYREALTELEEEVDHLTLLSEDLLALSQADSDSATLDFQELDVGGVLDKAVTTLSPIAKQKGVRVKFERREQAPFCGDYSKLVRMFVNILDNAVKYCPPDSMVSVSLTQGSDGIDIKIRDTGPGIDPEELDHVFDRFHRSALARQMNPGGSGLGLPIARWIAREHGGEIEVMSPPGEGATFKITLPPHQD
jgi:heavy metal sensor kinase